MTFTVPTGLKSAIDPPLPELEAVASPEKLIFPPLLLTAKFLALIVEFAVTLPAVSTTRFPKELELPTAPVKVTLPVPPFTVKLLLPLTVLSKVILLPVRIGLLAIVTAFP